MVDTVCEFSNRVVGILRQCGIQADACPGATIEIPCGAFALEAEAGPGLWTVTKWAKDGNFIEMRDIGEVDAAETDPEVVAVFILRCLLAAGRENRVTHPYVKKQ